MGVDVFGKGGSLSISAVSCDYMLRLAETYGWKPLGLSNVEDEFGDILRVPKQDAAKLADALERAMDDIPNHDVINHGSPQDGRVTYSADGQTAIVEGAWELIDEMRSRINVLEAFSGDRKRTVRDFITFCRCGEFMIG